MDTGTINSGLQCQYSLYRVPDVIMSHEYKQGVQQLIDEPNGKKLQRRGSVNPLLTTAEKSENKKSEIKTRQFILIMVPVLLLLNIAYQNGVIDLFIASFSAG